MKMRVILINPAFNRYGGIRGHGGSMTPLNLCYLAAYARQQFPEMDFKILDSEIKGLSHEETVKEVAKFTPDLIGITTNTGVFDSVVALIGMLKKRLAEVPVIIGGPHASALPESSLLESNADFAAIGEGELTFAELLSQMRKGENGWDRIDGLAYRDEKGNVEVNSRRGLIKDLDILPFPARDLVENKLYIPAATKRVGLGANTLIASSRGCPYNCGFCAAKTVWTRRIRVRKPEFVVDEIEQCVENFGIDTINFTDELFTVNKKRILNICSLIIERSLKIAWVCSARAQGLDKETLEAMKESGCREISFGIESGNQDILDRIDKSIDLTEALRVVRLAKKVGIKTHAGYILGYIGENEKTMQDTICFAKKLNTHVAAFFIASPLPGTRLYQEASEKGYIRPDSTWINYSPLSNTESVLVLPNLSTSTIRKWHRKALRDYYFRPRYIMSILLTIRHWYEIVNLFGGLKIFFRIKK